MKYKQKIYLKLFANLLGIISMKYVKKDSSQFVNIKKYTKGILGAFEPKTWI